jgi:hypothetical protein
MARLRQRWFHRWFVPPAVVSSASLIVFTVVGTTSAQTFPDDRAAMLGSAAPRSAALGSAALASSAVGSSALTPFAPASSESARPWPCHLIVVGELRAVAELAWEQSATFRDQCRKLASAGARIIVQPASSRDTWRAQTRIQKTDEGATIAFARVRAGTQSIELIAHELEHVIEYLEGIKFLMQAHRGGSGVRLAAGAYETRRAIDAGRRVAKEVRDVRPDDSPRSNFRADHP